MRSARLAFGRDHILEGRIAAIRSEQQIRTALARALRIRGQHARDELVAVIQPRSHAMHGADERAASAADHAEAQPPVPWSDVEAVRRTALRPSPSIREFCFGGIAFAGARESHRMHARWGE